MCVAIAHPDGWSFTHNLGNGGAQALFDGRCGGVSGIISRRSLLITAVHFSYRGELQSPREGKSSSDLPFAFSHHQISLLPCFGALPGCLYSVRVDWVINPFILALRGATQTFLIGGQSVRRLPRCLYCLVSAPSS